eukprot:JP436883.1.p1 GENE.JP436883.1~~JP436883.1.p1  ORF type:complete len:59 (-),score=2.59 JP436883.1:20-196(-)
MQGALLLVIQLIARLFNCCLSNECFCWSSCLVPSLESLQLLGHDDDVREHEDFQHLPG